MGLKLIVDQMDFAQAKSLQDTLYARWSTACDALNAFCEPFGKGPMGLTPDHVRAKPEFKALSRECDLAKQQLRTFNGPYAKKFKKEIYADTMARRQAKIKANREALGLDPIE